LMTVPGVGVITLSASATPSMIPRASGRRPVWAPIWA
jgi:hypothetical protein